MFTPAELDTDEVVRRLTTVKGGKTLAEEEEEVVIRVVDAVTPGGNKAGRGEGLVRCMELGCGVVVCLDVIGFSVVVYIGLGVVVVSPMRMRRGSRTFGAALAGGSASAL